MWSYIPQVYWVNVSIYHCGWLSWTLLLVVVRIDEMMGVVVSSVVLSITDTVTMIDLVVERMVKNILYQVSPVGVDDQHRLN